MPNDDTPDDGFRDYDAQVAALTADGPIASRRRVLFDRIIALDETGLAAMERAADMVEPGLDYGFRDAPAADA